MERYIINGSLYIKRRPSVKKEDKLLNQNTSIYNATTGKNIILKSIKDLEQLPPQVINVLRQQKILGTEETIIHDNLGFYQIFSDGSSLYMLGRENNQTFKYQSLDELEKDFISLEDFLNSGKYIGRELNGEHGTVELLYEFEGMYLLGSISSSFFITIGKDTKVMSRYVIGNILPHYYSKEEIYQAIIQSYINKNNGEARR